VKYFDSSCTAVSLTLTGP